MSIDVIEHDSYASLAALIDRIKNREEVWGIAVAKRKYLRSMTNEAFQLLVTHTLQGADEAHLFFVGDQNIYIAWRGKQKTIYLSLHNLTVAMMLLPGIDVDPAVVMTYLDPRIHGDKLKASCKAGLPNGVEPVANTIFADFEDDDDDGTGTHILSPSSAASGLKASREQIDYFKEMREQQSYRKELNILVVEDHLFSRKLLCEILRGFRVNHTHHTPLIDAVGGINDAWKSFLKKAPDIIFIDLNLPDGSGHTLARAIREIDQHSRVVIVTANNYEEELAVARQNNVDFFITKPYNQKQILDCVTGYLESARPKGGPRARAT